MHAEPKSPVNDGLGESLAQLKSTSERVQTVLCVFAMIGGGLCAFLGLGSIVVIGIMIGLAVAGVVIFKNLKRFSDQLDVQEHGFTLSLRGVVNQVRYDELAEFMISHTHHSANGAYVGSRAQLHFLKEGRLRPITCDLEYKQNKKSGVAINLLSQHCVAAVRNRLCAKLEREGELKWTANVFLTLDAVRISHGTNAKEQFILIEDIGDCRIVDNQMRMWKRDEAMPFAVVPIDSVNFAAIAQVFASLHEVYTQQAHEDQHCEDQHCEDQHCEDQHCEDQIHEDRINDDQAREGAEPLVRQLV